MFATYLHNEEEKQPDLAETLELGAHWWTGSDSPVFSISVDFTPRRLLLINLRQNTLQALVNSD